MSGLGLEKRKCLDIIHCVNLCTGKQIRTGNETAGKMERGKPGSTEDLATLANLDGKVLLNELKVRYLDSNIYVSTQC